MATVTIDRKPLSVRPLKASAPMGAVLATLGLARAIPLLHGSQGCSAFTKVYFTRHFREPIPMQTTAMEQISAVMGADDNLKQGLATVLEKSRAQMVAVITTGLSETEGVDLPRVVREFHQEHPTWRHVPVLAIHAPDYQGSLESGYASAVAAMVTTLTPPGCATCPPPGSRRLNILAGPALTPGDGESLHHWAEAFGLEAVLLPDLSGSMDGHLTDAGFTPLTTGGTTLEAWSKAGEAAATLVIGASLSRAAGLLQQRTGVPTHEFGSLTSLAQCDALFALLAEISGRPVPKFLQRQRTQYLDALLDTHFLLTGAKVALAGEPDWLQGMHDLLTEVGCDLSVVVSATSSPVLANLSCAQVVVGDLEDFARLIRQNGAEVALGNSHAADLAHEMGLPLLRAGYPIHDALGAFRRSWIGYRAMADALCDLADLLHHARPHGVAPYRSALAASAFAPS